MDSEDDDFQHPLDDILPDDRDDVDNGGDLSLRGLISTILDWMNKHKASIASTHDMWKVIRLQFGKGLTSFTIFIFMNTIMTFITRIYITFTIHDRSSRLCWKLRCSPKDHQESLG